MKWKSWWGRKNPKVSDSVSRVRMDITCFDRLAFKRNCIAADKRNCGDTKLRFSCLAKAVPFYSQNMIFFLLRNCPSIKGIEMAAEINKVFFSLHLPPLPHLRYTRPYVCWERFWPNSLIQCVRTEWRVECG